MTNPESSKYLSVTEAAAYLNVSPQTLRRWDLSGKLKPIRNNTNGYRYYLRSDLEPFRLDYQRAQMQLVDGQHFFQTITADIEGNKNLREPQKDAHKAVRRHFHTDNEHVILQIPVGCGKTGIMATLPFGIAEGRVLVITPNLTIRKGVAEALDFANPRNFWKKSGAIHDFSSGPYCAVLDGVDANLHDCNESHFVVTNIQQLASSADRWLPQFPPNYFDMILVDEGHHNVASSWMKVFERFPAAKVISLTATPFRGDGEKPLGKVIYKYPFTRAMVNGYIKQIHSRNVAPKQLTFVMNDSTKTHSLEEVLELREEAWFRRGVALSQECNQHIVDASIVHMQQLREKTGFKHQIIAVACSVDHARQVRSLYEERGYKAQEIFSEMDKDKQDKVIENLRSKKLDCIVQVQMLGEGFDHPPLSVAAIFRPFRSLSPYIQFIGRVMRVIHETNPDHPDNHAFIVSHVGLNNDMLWEDFRELDFEDQQMIHQWLSASESDGVPGQERQPRRFEESMMVDNEIVGDFIKQSFLDPNDDRVLEEFLNQSIAGIKLRDILSKAELQKRLLDKQKNDEKHFVATPVQPQRKRVQARKRLNERAKSVANRVLKELDLGINGRDLNKAQPNIAEMIERINNAINQYLGIEKKSRANISAEQAERAFSHLDQLGDNIKESVKKNK